MKKIITVSYLVIFSIVNAQHASLGFRNNMNFALSMVNLKQNNVSLVSYSPTTSQKIKFYNVNMRAGGSLIGNKIFKEDSRFFIGEYLEMGLGVGYGKKSTLIANETTFNALFGGQLGAASYFAISDDITIGLKAIFLGADVYFDYDVYPTYIHGLTFHPTVQFKRFFLTAGFGGRTRKNIPFKSFESEFRFNFNNDASDSWYFSLKYQLNTFDYLDDTYLKDSKLSTFNIGFGRSW
jgi:hypothetical protein